MMINIRKQRLAVAVAGTFSLMASTAQAAEFTATTDLQNTLAVTVISPLDIGTIFAAATGAAIGDGVGAMTIAADGTVDYDLSSTNVSLLSLGTPVPAQGSVDSTADFVLTLPDTSGHTEAQWKATGTDLEADFITNIGGAGLEHVPLRISADTTLPVLYLTHFTVGDVSGGAVLENSVGSYDGVWNVDMDFGESTYVFNIGATVVTQPGIASPGTGQLAYEEGTYSGTFEITASY